MGIMTTVREELMIEHQKALEHLYDKNQTLKRIRAEYIKEPALEKVMKLFDIDVDFGMDLLTQMSLHKRTTPAVMASILRHHFDNVPDGTQLTLNMIKKAVRAKLLHYNETSDQLVIRFDIDRHVQDEIDKFQYPLPMVVKPRKVTDNMKNGYLTSSGSLLLRKNHHDEDICLDHINRVNKIRFVINQDTALMIKNKWKNLDKPKVGESSDDYKKRVKAFEKYDRTAKQVIDTICRYSDDFYLTHKYDKRGRVYCQGYHVNYQGNPWNKAVIELADKELIP